MNDDDLPFSRPAGHVRSKLAAVGGTLSLDGRRLSFRPNAMAGNMGGKSWSTSLGAIDHVDTVGRNLSDIMCGGLRRRVQITTHAGEHELFVIAHAEKVAEELQALVQEDASHT